jgi:hypothetical protein
MSDAPVKLEVVPPFEGWKERQEQIQDALAEVKEIADAGKVHSIMIFAETADGKYTIRMSGCENRIGCAGYLMKLAMMRLGFAPEE